MFFLNCIAEIAPSSLSQSVFTPVFEWFYGPSYTSLPSGVKVLNVSSTGNIYNSTLQFSHLQLSHAGMYTCQLCGKERMATVTLNVECNGKS